MSEGTAAPLQGQKTIRVCVEGNIGAGKSTFIKTASKGREDTEIILEPVDIWENLGILEKFYKDPSRYAYSFQSIAYITRLSSVWEKQTKPIKITERSVWADKYCFAKKLRDDGTMDETEYKIYLTWSDVMDKKFADDITPDVFVHLKATPKICQERQKKRNRNSEGDIPLEYLEDLDDYHEKFLKPEVCGAPVEIFEIMEDSDVNSPEYIAKVQNFVDDLHEKYGKARRAKIRDSNVRTTGASKHSVIKRTRSEIILMFLAFIWAVVVMLE